MPPTLLTRQSIRPNRSAAAATSRSAAAALGQVGRDVEVADAVGAAARGDDPGALRAQLPRDFEADPGGRTGDDAHLAREAELHRLATVAAVTTLLLARHGETDWNREGRWQGWADPPLNETGRAQARALAEQLRDTPFDAVYSSDLRRAHETAEIVAEPHSVPVVADPGCARSTSARGRA